jgi:hypothetical protein
MMFDGIFLEMQEKFCSSQLNKWNQNLIFCLQGELAYVFNSVCVTVDSLEHHALDERINATCQQLLVNNLHSGNLGSLLHVFFSRASELLASAQTEK